MAESPAKFHIIGAGVAGLNTAQLLRQKYPHAEIIIYEAADHSGGRCYSFYDKELGLKLDNATHAILSANHLAAKLIGKKSFDNQTLFYDYITKKISTKIWQNIDDKALALFNQPLNKTAQGVVFKTFCKLFPFASSQLKLWFSTGDLSQKLIEPLSAELNIKTGWKLLDFCEKDGFIYKLCFNKGSVALLPQDKIISALDASNFSRIFGGAEFEYNEIINIFYRTSLQLSLPGSQNLLGISGAITQWLFTAPGLLAVTISNAKVKSKDEELAAEVWKEICSVRGHAAAFVPPHRILHHKRATIRQDETNNAKRPNTCQSRRHNLFLCGDWTMKNWPCSIEAALSSSERVVKKL